MFENGKRVDWCCHDTTPSGERTWAAGISFGENMDQGLVWPPADSEKIYGTAEAVIAAAFSEIDLFYGRQTD